MAFDSDLPFFMIDRDLPREGQGTHDDVFWAPGRVNLPETARVSDSACGPGNDLETLAAALPDTQIEGIDLVPHFVTEAQERVAGFSPRVTARQVDMASVDAPYFLGVTEGLRCWRRAVSPGCAVAFSERVMLSGALSDTEQRLWAEFLSIADMDGIVSRVSPAGYRACAHRVICGGPWAEYYDPMQARIDRLRREATEADMVAELDEPQLEIDLWRAAPDEIAYAVLIAVPE